MSIKPQVCSACKNEGHNKRNCPGPGITNCVIDVDHILQNQEQYDDEDYSFKRETIQLLEKNHPEILEEITFHYKNITPYNQGQYTLIDLERSEK